MKLSESQLELLIRICQTNGGGISAYAVNERTMRSLEKRELIQGKLKQPYMAVHTSKGLKLYRSLLRGDEETK